MSIPAQISALWLVVMLNMIFADILSLFIPGFIAEVSTGVVGGVTLTPMFLLVAAVFIEIGILMIFITGAVRPPVSRVLNMIAVPIVILFVVGGGSLTPHYVFFASIEVLALLSIFYLAWRWPRAEAFGG